MFNFLKKRQPAALPVATDIHCHIIPGIDDGSPDPAISAELIERMISWGFRRIIASPHVTQDTFENTPATIAPALEALKGELSARNIGIDLSHHAEYRLDEFFMQQAEAGNLRPLPGNYLLVENPFAQEPWNLDQILFDLRLKGFTPILAHPERYPYYSQYRRERYEQLHSAGTLFQINLLSLAGHYGKLEKQTAEWLIKENMVDFLGTDLHHHRHADSIEAYLTSRDATRHFSAMTHLLNDSL